MSGIHYNLRHGKMLKICMNLMISHSSHFVVAFLINEKKKKSQRFVDTMLSDSVFFVCAFHSVCRWCHRTMSPCKWAKCQTANICSFQFYAFFCMNLTIYLTFEFVPARFLWNCVNRNFAISKCKYNETNWSHNTTTNNSKA